LPVVNELRDCAVRRDHDGRLPYGTDIPVDIPVDPTPVHGTNVNVEQSSVERSVESSASISLLPVSELRDCVVMQQDHDSLLPCPIDIPVDPDPVLGTIVRIEQSSEGISFPVVSELRYCAVMQQKGHDSLLPSSTDIPVDQTQVPETSVCAEQSSVERYKRRRRKGALLEPKRRRRANGKILASDDNRETYWAIEAFLKKKIENGVVKYLVKWENSSVTSWERADNLNDAALAEAELTEEISDDIPIDQTQVPGTSVCAEQSSVERAPYKRRRRKGVFLEQKRRSRANGKILASDDNGETYWAIEAFLRKKIENGVVKYLVKWENSSVTSWERADNLNDAALAEAELMEGIPVDVLVDQTQVLGTTVHAAQSSVKQAPIKRRRRKGALLEPKRRSRAKGEILGSDDNGETYWAIEAFLRKKIENGVVKYLVKWESSSVTSWERADNLNDAAIAEAELMDGEILGSDDNGEAYWAIEAFLAKNIDENGEAKYLIKWENSSVTSWERSDNLNAAALADAELLGGFCLKCSVAIAAICPHTCWHIGPPENLSSSVPPSKERGNKTSSPKQRPQTGKSPHRKGTPDSNRKARPSPSRKKLKVSSWGETNRHAISSGQEWQLPDCDRGGTLLGKNMRVVSVRVMNETTAPKTEPCILSHMFGDRVLTVVWKFSREQLTEPAPRTLSAFGRRYELISRKVLSDGVAFQHWKPKCVHFVYAQISGRGFETLDLSKELLEIADFKALSTRKAAARLELLRSPAIKFSQTKPGLVFLQNSQFCEVADRGYVGCGFISEEMLDYLSGNRAKPVHSIQVRIVIPKMGLYKGMLVRKRIIFGPPIQLPASMKKIPASKNRKSDDDRAILLISDAHPSRTNDDVERLVLGAKANAATTAEFKPRQLSDMITRLWLGLGVPKEICDGYMKKSLHQKFLNHAWLVGVADPTDKLPTGHIFVPGLNKKTLFVTRSPCMTVEDGRMLPVVSAKPKGMTDAEWKWLNKRSFGEIIFANPKKGMMALPEMIAKGDLDGDLYFICWNKVVLDHVKAVPIQDTKQQDKGDDNVRKLPNDNWLSNAQKLMTDGSSLLDLEAITGKLYSLSKKAADDSPLFLRDRDAVSFARAYKQALDIGKHGGKIALPTRLHGRLPIELVKKYI
jgi:hypothetical protein